MNMDKIVLKWSDNYYQTFVLDIDHRPHLLWLKKQYKLGATMTAHSFIEAPTSTQNIRIPTKQDYR